MQTSTCDHDSGARRDCVESEAALIYRSLSARPATLAAISVFEQEVSQEDCGLMGHPLVIIPGAFYREYPAHQADGSQLIEAATKLGIQALRIPVPSFCSVQVGASYIGNWLEQWNGPPVVLLALSKGAADVAALLSSPKAAPLMKKVIGWISVSGILTGSPLVNYIDRSMLRRFYFRFLLRVFGYRYRDILSLKWSDGTLPMWCNLPHLPFPVFHLMAVPEPSELGSRLSQRAYRRVLPYGASDGGGILLRDLIRYPGTVIPLQGQDHYMREVIPEDLLRRMAVLLRSTTA